MSRETPTLLLDEHIWEGLAAALRGKGYDVVHLNHINQRSIDDEAVLSLAAAQSRALLTNNHRDFVPLARAWFEAEHPHAGIILSIQLPPGELLRQTTRLLQSLSMDELANTVRWLQEFK